MPNGTINKMGVKHSAILDYILLHEGKCSGRELCEHFGMTQAWISCIVNSDAFKAELAARKEQMNGMVMFTLNDRINGLAAQSMEKLGQLIEVSNDPDFMLDVADKMLKNAGYGKPAGPAVTINNNTQNNTYLPVAANVLEECRAQMLPKPEDTFNAIRIPPASEVLECNERDVGGDGADGPELRLSHDSRSSRGRESVREESTQ